MSTDEIQFPPSSSNNPFFFASFFFLRLSIYLLLKFVTTRKRMYFENDCTVSLSSSFGKCSFLAIFPTTDIKIRLGLSESPLNIALFINGNYDVPELRS